MNDNNAMTSTVDAKEGDGVEEARVFLGDTCIRPRFSFAITFV